MNEALATKGPQGTVSHKTQISLQLLIKETDRLTNNIWVLNPACEEFVDLTNLLTTGADLGEGPDGPRPPLLVEYL